MTTTPRVLTWRDRELCAYWMPLVERAEAIRRTRGLEWEVIARHHIGCSVSRLRYWRRRYWESQALTGVAERPAV